MSRRLLQAVMALLALVPLSTGFRTMRLGSQNPWYKLPAAVDPMLDTAIRFYGGMFFALGLLILWTIPRIEERTETFRAIWLLVFVGGLGRLVGEATFMPMPPAMHAWTALEILGAPLAVYWQWTLARR